MTLDEVIQHCEEVANRDCSQCSKYHEQYELNYKGR